MAQKIDLNTLYKQNKLVQLGAGIVIVLLLLVAGYFAVFKGQWEEFELTVAVSASATMNSDSANIAPVVMPSESASATGNISASVPNTPVAPASSATATSSPAN